MIGSYLEEICLLELEKRIGIKIINRLNTHIIDIPLLTHSLIYISVTDHVHITSNLKMNSRFVQLTHSTEEHIENQSAGIGISENKLKSIELLALPNVNDVLNKNEEIIALHNVAEVYYLNNCSELAMDYYSKALKISEELNLTEAIAFCNANIGNVFKMKGQFGNAKRHWELSQRLFKEIGNKYAATVESWLEEI